MKTRRAVSWLFLAAVPLGGTACLATRGDIRLLQQDNQVMQREVAEGKDANAQQVAALAAQTARGDSLLREQVKQVLAIVGTLSDSVRVANDRLLKFRADYGADQVAMNTTLLQLQERLGASQQQLSRLQDQIDSDVQRETGRDTTHGAPASQTYATLRQADKLAQQNSFATAREAYQAVLAAPDVTPAWAAQAMSGIGATYEGEKKPAQADSVYRVLSQKYPGTDDAANALYKQGNYLLQNQKPAAAKVIFEQLLKDDPSSQAARLAKDKLATIK